MNNKTCNDCRYMLHKDTFEVCTLRMTETAMFDNACEHFTPPTVGDRIRQMSDEELAELFVYFKRRTTDEDVYGSILFKQIPFEGKQRAYEETLEELRKEAKIER